jgi:hypothetical protein
VQIKGSYIHVPKGLKTSTICFRRKSSNITLLGAFSNHIAAVAFAGKEKDSNYRIINGDELAGKLKSHVVIRSNCGMQLEFYISGRIPIEK